MHTEEREGKPRLKAVALVQMRTRYVNARPTYYYTVTIRRAPALECAEPGSVLIDDGFEYPSFNAAKQGGSDLIKHRGWQQA